MISVELNLLSADLLHQEVIDKMNTSFLTGRKEGSVEYELTV